MKLGWAILVSGMMAASAASAATVYRLDAKSVSSTIVSDFWLKFDDLDGDTLFSEDELLGFSGVSFLLSGILYDVLRKTPVIAGFADGATPLPQWSFETSTGSIGVTGSNSFTYRVSEIPASVPLPATALAMIAGLGGLAGLRRRRTRNPANRRVPAQSRFGAERLT